jgi:hypothetical protein
MSLSDDAQNLGNLLFSLTQPNTEAIRNAEATLKPLLKDQRCIPPLFEVVSARGAVADPVRHVAAVLLRKRISGHYKSFPVEYRAKINADVISLLGSEHERTVRNGIVGVASAICKVTCSDDEEEGKVPEQGIVPWPELFQFIAAASMDANADARELAFLLLFDLADIVGNYMKPQFTQIGHLFQTILSSTNELPKVKNAAVKALGALMSYLSDEKEIDVFCNLMPSLLQVSLECQKRNDEDTVSTVLDVMYDLSFSPSTAVTAHLADIVRFCLGCLVDTDIDMNIRDSAALVIATMAESKPKLFGKNEVLLSSVLSSIFDLIEKSDDTGAGALFETNPHWKEDLDNDDEDYDPENDDNTPTETSIAQGTLDILACEIPKKYIFKRVVTMCVERMASPQERHRKAGVACLGVIAEGCAEPLQEHLSQIMPHVLATARDSSAIVRECCCFALGQLSEHCQPDILGYSNEILPIVFSLLDDNNTAVQATSCYVLEMFCERLEPERVRPMLDSLVKKLAHMLETTSKRSVQEMTVAALAATAVAAENEFAPYIDGIATLMFRLITLREEKLFSLRGRALECMGHMAIAVGKDTFRPYFTQTMQSACEGLTFDSTDLHEFAYALFANLSKVMEEEFSPCLPELVPHLFGVIGQDEGSIEEVTKQNQSEFGNLDDSDDEDNYGSNLVLQVRTALLDAKKGAITAIGEIATHCGDAFHPFLETGISLLQKSAKNWHPIIKAEVAEAFPSMVNASVAVHHGGDVQWTKGDITGPSPLSPQTTAVASVVLNELVILMSEDDTETVGKACEGIQNVIELCGPHSLAIVANECLQNTHGLLSRTAPCQEDDEYEDDDDHDSYMTSVCDLVGAFARVMGSHLVQYLPTFLPAVLFYAKQSRPSSDRAMAIGCLGEIAQGLEGGIKDYWASTFYPTVLSGLADEDSNVKRNAAFCSGVCCEVLGDSVASDYLPLLQALSPLFHVDPNQGDSAAACVDNAAAAVCRMISACPNNVPIPQVLPVVLKVLPLKNDVTENDTVYKCLLGLLQMNHPDVISQKHELSRVFAEAAADGSDVDDEIKEKLKMALTSLQ